MFILKNCKHITIRYSYQIFSFLFFFLLRTYRASNEKRDDVAPASNNLSHVHKLILETQKRFKDQEQERKQMEVSFHFLI